MIAWQKAALNMLVCLPDVRLKCLKMWLQISIVKKLINASPSASQLTKTLTVLDLLHTVYSLVLSSLQYVLSLCPY